MSATKPKTGRKSVYGEPAETISLRIPQSRLKQLDRLARSLPSETGARSRTNAICWLLDQAERGPQ
jgi:hypothetical protein